MYLLDTNILSETIRPRPSAAVMRTLTHTARPLRFASEITRYEMRFGARLLDDGGRLWSRIERDVLPVVDWLPLDESVSLAAADIGAALRRTGQPLEWTDLLLAATGIVHSLTVVTRNTRHFERVPGLNIQNWFHPA